MSIAKKQVYPQGNVVEVFNLKVSLTANQIQNAATSPIDIGLPASGAGYYYRVTQFDANLIYGTAPFVSQLLLIGTVSTGAPQREVNSLAATANDFRMGGISSNLIPNIAENDIVSIWADVDSVGDGDSTIDCYITVEKVAL